MSQSLTTTGGETTLMASIDDQISRTNQLHDEAKRSFARGCDLMILCGLQLATIKSQCAHGEWESLFDGAERRVKAKPAPNGPSLGHFNFGKSTAARYIALAEEAQKRIAKLDDLAGKDFGRMTESWQLEVVAAIRASIGPASYSQLAAEWGVIKRPGPQGGDVSPRGPDGKRIRPTPSEQAARQIEAAEEVVGVAIARLRFLLTFPDQMALAKPETRRELKQLMLEVRDHLNLIKD